MGRRCKKTYRITTPTANGVDGTKRMLQIEYQQTNNTRDTKGHERVKEVRKKFGRIIRKDGGGGGLLGVRQQEKKVMKRIAGWGPLASREF